ncbi:helix-turn-helix domain-containing protein [Marinisporobacter balticus]|uniref:AraC-like DNA-binding protein n=1 Tax=Marinisporobacter balticus TaxID=2018667 RepID=A0A4R2L219_9FIRM|nr:helix-turn-helix domain-containing protein [Marinisporobacter balticus]TCO77919.1 AraC-like DNA-binding protein [Marinisporobacter balticus]
MLNLLQTIRYPVRHPMLKRLIKYYWVTETKSSVDVNHKLLPVSNIDLILNFSSPIRYSKDEKTKVVPRGFHFNGISNKYYLINQSGVLRVLGISFFPTGLFPILKIPISEFKDETVEIDLIIKGFTENIVDKINITDSIHTIIKIIETEVVKIVDVSRIPRKEIYEVFDAFNQNINDLSINDFCKQYGINQRQIERIFNKYIGISPKLFYRINRFQETVNYFKKSNNNSFTSLAYNNNYYDQTHFIKDFKSFTGSTPTEFLNQNSSIKQIIKYY